MAATKNPQGRPNRLIREKSPYLLQHAYNPVDWHPWGPEAFEKARKEKKPVFLSIGYATCHWCHVMERESFEDPEVARRMNEVFISIKVDREERPDLDHLYMAACQLMTGSGGWPLTLLLTPEKKPFFAGTYFPKESRFGRLGMLDLIARVQEIWTARSEDVFRTAEQMAEALQRVSGGSRGGALGQEVLQAAYEDLARRFDESHGGFSGPPKFPTPHNLLFLLRYWRRSGEEKALSMVEKTLQAMRRGGIFDQIGYGFHRYSTDPQWLVPHFEKMLYDQALLALAYTEAFQATGREEYGRTARQVFTYVLQDMTAPEGGFYSAEDAESEGEEGKFYLWTGEEIRSLLEAEEADLAVRVFHVESRGNFTDPMTGGRTGENILHLTAPLEATASDLGIPEGILWRRLEGIRETLFAAREGRPRPLKDDKILTDWNGLMVAALAKGFQAFDEPRYGEAARRAVDFLLRVMRTPDGRLLHRYREGEAALSGNADDYAFLIWGLMEMYGATFEGGYLRTAVELNHQFLEHFWDEAEGGFYFTPDDGEELLLRRKESHDGAVPSSNSVAMGNLLRLGRMTGNREWEEKAARIGQAFSGAVQEMPSAFVQMLAALDFGVGPSYEVVVVGPPGRGDTEALLRVLRTGFLPHAVVLFVPMEEESPEILHLPPFTRDLPTLEGRATAYVCRNYACQRPTTDAHALEALLTNGERNR
jgi:hypothetical protein